MRLMLGMGSAVLSVKHLEELGHSKFLASLPRLHFNLLFRQCAVRWVQRVGENVSSSVLGVFFNHKFLYLNVFQAMSKEPS